MFAEAVTGKCRDLFRLACERDLEGVVAKLASGTYQTDGRSTSWVKVKNPEYSQAEGRAEFFENRRKTKHQPTPVLVLK